MNEASEFLKEQSKNTELSLGHRISARLILDCPIAASDVEGLRKWRKWVDELLAE